MSKSPVMGNRELSNGSHAKIQNGSRIAVMLPPALTDWFEVVLTRVLQLKNDGQEVAVVHCTGAIRGCVVNPAGLKVICGHCNAVTTKALTEIAPTVRRVPLTPDAHGQPACTISGAVDRELGVSTDSTILTFYRRDASGNDSSIAKKIYGLLRLRLLRYSEQTYSLLAEIIRREEISRMEFFNGRIVPTRAAMCAAKDAGIDFGVIEVSGREKQLFTSHNRSVHDLSFWQDAVDEFVSRNKVDQQEGVEFFEARRRGAAIDAPSFVQKQKKGALTIDSDRPILAIFTSSADELKVNGQEWFTPTSVDPVTFIRNLANSAHQTHHIVVRMHPNQGGDKTGEAENMQRELSKIANLQLIRPNDSQSTYELIDRADCVLTFGSTVGLEATYWGKPSILCGRAVWDRKDIAYRIDSAAELMALLRTRPRPLSKRDATALGSYYMQGIGSPSALGFGPLRFTVAGKSYLPEKRRGIGYWISRVTDRLLRKM